MGVDGRTFWRASQFTVTQNQGDTSWSSNYFLSSGICLSKDKLRGRENKAEYKRSLGSWFGDTMELNTAENYRTKVLMLRALLGSLKSLLSVRNSPAMPWMFPSIQ